MRRQGSAEAPRGSRPRSLLRASLAGLALCALLASPALAEERKHSWEAGVFAGYTLFGGEMQLDDNTDFGLRVGWNLAPPYEVEIQYYRSSGSKINDLNSTLVANDAVYLDNPGRKWTATAYTARFIINPRNERRRFKPYAQFGLGVLNWTPSPSLTKQDEGDLSAFVFSPGLGFRYRLGAYTQVRAEFEDIYAIAEVYSNLHLNVGLTWVFGGGPPADSDGDGILDMKDRCPDTPKGALVDKHDGCPWDLDGDGVMEGLDQCPSTPAGWPVDDRGCPVDTDGDGVPDGADKCADTPKGAVVDSDGCPVDSDKDGIFDGIDRCPGTPVGAIVDPADSATPGCPHDTDEDGVFDGVDQCALTPPGATVDDKGCPKDSDGDKVLDGLDQCPDTPHNQKIDREGCPRVRLDKSEAQILQNVKFYGMELYPGVDAWLELLVDAANYWPDVKFEVGVYTDNEGGVAKNRAVAQRRAEVLKGWLIHHGVPASRFVMKAYGPVDFIADNSTEEGRETNRRVTVKRLSGDIHKHPAPLPEAPETAPEAPAAAPGEEKTPPAQAPAAETPAAQTPAGQEAPAGSETPPAAQPEKPEKAPEAAPEKAPEGEKPPEAQKPPAAGTAPEAGKPAGGEKPAEGEKPPEGEKTPPAPEPPADSGGGR